MDPFVMAGQPFAVLKCEKQRPAEILVPLCGASLPRAQAPENGSQRALITIKY